MPPESQQLATSVGELDVFLEPVDNLQLANMSGQFDENLQFMGNQLGVEIHHRGHHFTIRGSGDALQAARHSLLAMYAIAGERQVIKEDVHLLLRQTQTTGNSKKVMNKKITDHDVINTRYGKVRPRGENQQIYLNSVQHHDVNFGVGPAGTGKTYLAVACAVDALEREEVRRIILARPAVEAGERLGFLPGDLSQKVDPYLRPLYDALFEMMGVEKVTRLIERNIIEIAPLAYMRGRTLNDSFIILDEAQNTTIEQMKMFLTRIGFGSTAVITGDITQIDLPREQPSGLKHVIEVLQGVEGISFTFFKSHDVVRHKLVQKIVEAYEKFARPKTHGG